MDDRSYEALFARTLVGACHGNLPVYVAASVIVWVVELSARGAEVGKFKTW